MKIGLAGLRYSGKTSLFKLLTGSNVSYEKSGVNIGTARVPDKRIDALAEIYKPEKITYAALELADIPGIDLNKNRSFFADIRKVDLLLVVLRDFADDIHPNPLETNDYRRDLGIIKDELLLQDMVVTEKRLESLAGQLKKQGCKELQLEYEVLRRAAELLNQGEFLAKMELSGAEEKIMRNHGFFTRKALLPIINTDEDKITAEYDWPAFSLQVEAEIAALPEQDREEYCRLLGVSEPALDRIVRAVYRQAGLISFFTVGKDEVRAWTIVQGTTAKAAAGKIHSDLEKGFIRAEVCAYEDFIKCRDMSIAKNDNKVRLESKDYIVRDGDMLNIRFNV